MSRGFLTFVQNNSKTDYLNIAYLQALSLKVTSRNNQYAIVVDAHTQRLITDRHRRVFDHIIPVPGNDDAADQQWKMNNEWKALMASPFDQTIKVEADLLFTSSVDHWWDILGAQDVCFTNHVVDYTEKRSEARDYRKVFDNNQLPDIYAGLYYFKKSDTANELFEYVENIFKHWIYVKNYLLKNAVDEPASTDLVFAMAAKMLGVDRCTRPGPIPTFVHMKNAIQGWSTDVPWTELVHCEFDNSNLTVGFQRQRLPFHYQLKSFANPDTIRHYEQLYFAKTK